MPSDRSLLPVALTAILGDCLRHYPAQIGSQLLARLDSSDLALLPARLRRSAEQAALRLLHPTVARPGGPLLASIPRTGSTLLLHSSNALYAREGQRVAIWTVEALAAQRAPAVHYLGLPRKALVTAMAESPGEKEWLAGCGDGSVRTGDRILPVHKSAVQALAVGPESGHAVSIAYYCDAKIWDRRTGQTLLELEQVEPFEWNPWTHEPNLALCGMHWTPERILLHAAHTVFAWCPRSGRLLWRQSQDSLNEGAFALSPDGRRALVDSRLVDLENFAEIPSRQGGPLSCRRAAFSADGRFLYHTDRGDGRLFVRDAGTLELSHTFDIGECDELLSDRDGRVIAVGSRTRWWNPLAPEPSEPPLIRCPRLRQISLDHHGFTALLTGRWTTRICYPEAGIARPARVDGKISPDGTFRVWNGVKYHLDANAPVWEPNVAGETVAESVPAAFALIWSAAGDLCLIDYSTETTMPVADFRPEDLRRLREADRQHAPRHLSANGRFFAFQERPNGPLHCWNLEKGWVAESPAINGAAYQLALAANGSGLLATVEMGLAAFFVAGNQVSVDETMAEHEPVAMALSEDGRRAVSIREDTLTVWRISPLRSLAIASFTFDFRPRRCALSGDGSLMAVGDEADRLHFLRLAEPGGS